MSTRSVPPTRGADVGELRSDMFRCVRMCSDMFRCVLPFMFDHMIRYVHVCSHATWCAINLFRRMGAKRC
eukprot:10573989-Alexandrium_andersonii.AAC.1